MTSGCSSASKATTARPDGARGWPPRWDGDRWRRLALDSGAARLSRERVAATRKEWAKPPADRTAEGNGVTGRDRLKESIL